MNDGNELKWKFTDAFWNYKAGKFDNKGDYLFSFREPRGFFRGAKISSKFHNQQQKD
jgi:hypothetical protein